MAEAYGELWDYREAFGSLWKVYGASRKVYGSLSEACKGAALWKICKNFMEAYASAWVEVSAPCHVRSWRSRKLG